jgi:putative transposase
MLYVRYTPSLRNVEDLLAERGINISHETVRFWWESVWPHIRRRASKEARCAYARLSAVAVAFG